MAGVEDADMKLTLTLSGIPYGTQLKSIFHFINEKLAPLGIKLKMPEEEGVMVNSFMLIRLNSLQEAIKAMAALSAETFGYSTLVSTFYFGNLRVHAGKFYESIDMHDKTIGDQTLVQSIDIMKDFEKQKIAEKNRRFKNESTPASREIRRSGVDSESLLSDRIPHIPLDEELNQTSEDRLEAEEQLEDDADDEFKNINMNKMPGKFEFSPEDDEKPTQSPGVSIRASSRIEIYDFELDSEDEKATSEEKNIEHLDNEKANMIDSMLSDLDKKLKK